ncbi:type 4 fimbrial biogenesis protein PilQ [gamma proteobacterium HTCC2207]|uniref:Type 4 fimbrial biogenesis protein PilQ n=1 Tax=gamma proteobacterium HTCC2207 TaxID=314287 RepID=Q1YS04_9GAMM|nr:type 4 fimbrial biogenesis protein PilQ [gamma proteobacterium HTCC2207]
MISRIKCNIYFLLALLPGLAGAATQVTDIEFASLQGDQFEIRLQFSEQPPQANAYEIGNPARLVVDFPGVESSLPQKKYALGFENANEAVIISDGSRMRLIVNLNQSIPFEIDSENNSVTVRAGAGTKSTLSAQSNSLSEDGSQLVRAPVSSAQISSATNIADAGQFKRNALAVTDVDFRRSEDGSGSIVIGLSQPSVNVDINRSNHQIQLSFYQTELPDQFDRRLDVVDFATPVKTIDSKQVGTTTTVTIDASGQYDYLAYQADGQYVVNIKPLTDAEVEEQSRKFAFNGERLTLDFQDIEVRSVLQIIAEFTSLNLVASDTVTGNITLWLDDVPWDQALEIILKAKGLDKRQEGNVLMVAPAAEIAEQERLQVEANKQLQELAPLETTFVRIKYADAAEIFELFTASRGDEGQSSSGGREGNATTTILSERGSAIVDERTNTIILTDTEDKINAFKRLIDEIDVPIKQVLIEARIVIANTDFKKELGVTWGLAGIEKLTGGTIGSPFGDKTLGFSGRRSGLTPGAGVKETFTYSADEIETDDDGITTYTRNYDIGLGDSLAVDLGVDNPTGSFSLGYLTDNFLIDLELSALESDGFGEIVSQPKVLTGDKQQAVIKSGTEIAYQKATSSGATSIEFKEAVLQLEVTPQITPDNRIIMDLLVSQDSVGAFTPTGEPSIDITQIETQALVGNGQTLVLEGIFQTEEVNGTDKVPLLGDLPFLGKLFRNDLRNIEKREILSFITPKIIDDNLLDR